MNTKTKLAWSQYYKGQALRRRIRLHMNELDEQRRMLLSMDINVTLSTSCTCHNCHWIGQLKNLMMKQIFTPYVDNNTLHYDSSYEPCCPACQSINIIIQESH